MSGFAGIQLESRSTPTQIASGLIELVLAGQLEPGSVVRESMIAADLGVSRNTVREAVRLLEHSGVAHYELNRGVVVKTPSESNVRDIYRARLAIEVGAVYTAPRAADAGAIVSAALKRLLDALGDEDREAMVNADLDFHAALVAGAGSRQLVAAYAPVLNELRLYVMILSREGGYRDLSRLQAEHTEIAELYVSGKRSRAAGAVSRHVRKNAERVSEIARAFSGA